MSASLSVLPGGDGGKSELRPWLSVWNVNQPSRVRRVVLPVDGPFLVGTLPQCDLVIESDQWVSRRHVNFEAHGGCPTFWTRGVVDLKDADRG